MGTGRLTAYVTDVEGQWEKLAGFARGNEVVRLDEAGRLQVAPGALFVFGGDAVDRGPAGRRVLRALAEAKRRQPGQVVLLSGNRDLNKLRLFRELRGAPPQHVPAELRAGPRGALLRWIFANTMGAKAAFGHRAAELGGAPDEEVVQSFLDDLAPGGAMRDYLSLAQLAHREGATLFVHGAVTAESLGVAPGAPRTQDPDEWVAALNAFHAAQVRAFEEDDGREPLAEPAWEPLVQYQAPVHGTRLNQASVVYGRHADPDGNPLLPAREVTARLLAAGIARVVVGHTPSGDCPAVLRDEGFELVLADNSYGRVEEGSQVLLEDGRLRVAGATVLDGVAAGSGEGGERVEVRLVALRGEESPLGRVVAGSGELVKGRLADGRWLLFRSFPGNRVTQRAVGEGELGGMRAPGRG